MMAARIYILSLALVFFQLFILGPAKAGMDFGVTPPRIDLTVKPGEKKQIEVTVSNHGTRELKVIPGMFDFNLDEKGNAYPLEPKGRANSCTTWLKDAVKPFSLESKEVKKLQLTLQAPYGKKGGQYCAMLFEALPANKTNASVEIGLRTGTLLLTEIARTGRAKAEIVEFTSTDTGRGQYEFNLMLENTGNTHIVPEATVVILDTVAKRVLARLEMEGGTSTILPQGKRLYHASCYIPGEIKKDVYLARAVVRARKLRIERELTLGDAPMETKSE